METWACVCDPAGDRVPSEAASVVAGALPAGDCVSALFAAAKDGRAGCVARLIAAGADVNAPCGDDTPLFAAAKAGRVDCLALLVAAGADVDRACDGGESPLFAASREGHEKAVSLLVDAGADVDAGDRAERTPVFAAANGGHAGCLAVLIAAGADVNAPSASDEVPLLAACEAGHTACVEVLIGGGADVDYASHFTGCTPLHYACRSGGTTIVLRLAAAGADLKRKFCVDQTPLAFAVANGHVGAAAALLLAGDTLASLGDLPWTPGLTSGHRCPGIFAVLSLFGFTVDASKVSAYNRPEWVAIAHSSRNCGRRLALWCTGRAYRGVNASWPAPVTSTEVSATVSALCQAIPVDRLHCLEVFATAWSRHGGVVGDTAPGVGPGGCGLAGVSRTVRLRRVCRVVEGRGAVEPFGQAVLAFL